ncbi:alpha/beta fold hydrolase [Streptomyces actuosus]|uniref:Alpha/beta fold hydrolase n=1 Tax=Streptomyces actuosus TaxID=1885 RepID=A0ABS2VNG7_STRAS|nr:alpha/beta hydrolase [Streptomyces actuosus]MBN0044665.1 alpha/beta fold hydrolase [Streptomyces actuosus]
MPDLHHDVRGRGPLLLVLPGGAGHPMGLDPLVEPLADRFTVVTYDPLGLAHGRLGMPVGDQRVEDWGDGASRVLHATLPDGESAYVLGLSSGGIAALDLLARHGERLAHVVAHEAPCVAPLPDGRRRQKSFAAVCDTYRTLGPAAAAARLTAVLEDREAPPAADTAARPLSREEELRNPTALFLRHVLGPFTAHRPDLPAPGGHGGPARLTFAAGVDSRDLLLHRTARFLAGRTGGGFAEFPGGHVGAGTHPEEFAERLTAV